MFQFANEICQILRDRFPGLIGDQILRVDFFQHVITGKYYLNEVEGVYQFKCGHICRNDAIYYLLVVLYAFLFLGFNAQIVGTDTPGAIRMINRTFKTIQEYWYIVICELAEYHMRRRVLNL